MKLHSCLVEPKSKLFEASKALLYSQLYLVLYFVCFEHNTFSRRPEYVFLKKINNSKSLRYFWLREMSHQLLRVKIFEIKAQVGQERFGFLSQN